jgi:hypothetical protein
MRVLDYKKWEKREKLSKSGKRKPRGYADEAEQVHQQFVRVSSRLEPEHLEIYRKFKLSGNPLPRKRMEGKIIEKSINQ